MKIKGVNLGGWLVLEKWITPYMFSGTDADDERKLYETIDLKVLYDRLTTHRESFITERDFSIIRNLGLNIVRLPIPYYIFNDVYPYLGCEKYVDLAFQWAEKYQIKILLDLHTVPGGQNAFDNSGLAGICTWHLKQENINQTLDVIRKLCQKYGHLSELFGIEVINEPIDETMWQLIGQYSCQQEDVKHYPSSPVPTAILKDYYLKCYQIIDQNCDSHVKMIIHDGFRLEQWNDFMKQNEYPRLIIDTHLYINFEIMHKKEKSSDDYLDIIREKFKNMIISAQKYHPVLVGEWSLGNKLTDKKKDYDKNLHLFFQTQKDIFEYSLGWIFWNYKVLDHGRIEWDYENYSLLKKG